MGNNPRVEIDLVAFCASLNEVIAFEVKNYLDSGGVPFAHVTAKHKLPKGQRYKLFTCKSYRDAVLVELRSQLIKSGFLPTGWQGKIRLGLIAARVQNDHEDRIRQHFTANGWVFVSDADVVEKLTALARIGYEDNQGIVTAKILVRAEERRANSAAKAAKAVEKAQLAAAKAEKALARSAAKVVATAR